MSVAEERSKAHFDAFDQQVTANLSCVQWYGAAREFIRAARPVLQWEAMDEDTRSAIMNFARVPSLVPQSLINSLYVTTAAAFEEFCRLVIHSACEEFNDKKCTLSEEEELRRFLIVQTSRTLSRAHSPPVYLSLNQDDLCSSIGSMASGAGPIRVVGEAMCDVKGILEFKVVLDQLKKLGKDIDWQTLAKDGDLQRTLGTRKTKETETELKRLISAISKNRNRIAHVGPSSSDVTQEVLQDHAKALLAIGDAVVRNL